MQFEDEQRRKRVGYIDPNYQEEQAEVLRERLSPQDRALDWAKRHPFSIVGGSWAVSIAGQCTSLTSFHLGLLLTFAAGYRCIRYYYA